MTSWEVSDEPVAFADAVRQRFEPFAIGTAWGRPWGTTWFHVTGTIPGDWVLSDGEWCELVVDLGFNTGVPGFQSEALVFSPDGAIVSALEPLNRSVILDGVPGDSFELYLEAASNPDMAQGFPLAGCYCRTGGQLLPFPGVSDLPHEIASCTRCTPKVGRIGILGRLGDTWDRPIINSERPVSTQHSWAIVLC